MDDATRRLWEQIADCCFYRLQVSTAGGDAQGGQRAGARSTVGGEVGKDLLQTRSTREEPLLGSSQHWPSSWQLLGDSL